MPNRSFAVKKPTFSGYVSQDESRRFNAP